MKNVTDCVSSYLRPIFIVFSLFLKKLFASHFVPCPAVVPGLSHAFSGTQKSLEKGQLALFFSLVPLIFNKKVIFVSVCGPIRGHLWPELVPFVIQKGYKWGRFDPFSDTNSNDFIAVAFRQWITIDPELRLFPNEFNVGLKPNNRLQTSPPLPKGNGNEEKRDQLMVEFSNSAKKPRAKRPANHRLADIDHQRNTKVRDTLNFPLLA